MYGVNGNTPSTLGGIVKVRPVSVQNVIRWNSKMNKLEHKPKLSSYDHVIKMTKRRLAREKRVSNTPVKTGKYISLVEDRKHRES